MARGADGSEGSGSAQREDPVTHGPVKEGLGLIIFLYLQHGINSDMQWIYWWTEEEEKQQNEIHNPFTISWGCDAVVKTVSC